MPTPGTLHDAFLDELRDTYDAELQITKAIPAMVTAATSPTLKAAFEAHLKQTHGQISRLGAPTPSVTDADPITGKAEIRTSSIAARMERPRSVEAKDFTVATRFDIVGKLAALGLDMDEIELTGLAVAEGSDAERFDAVGQPRRTLSAKLGALRDARFAGVLSDPDPQDTKRDESAYFLGGVDLSDHTIALLRRAEGVVRRYRHAWERCRKALAAVEPLLGQAQARLAVAARELAEARQDVATARALLADDPLLLLLTPRGFRGFR